jgi:hypothetical protein
VPSSSPPSAEEEPAILLWLMSDNYAAFSRLRRVRYRASPMLQALEPRTRLQKLGDVVCALFSQRLVVVGLSPGSVECYCRIRIALKIDG